MNKNETDNPSTITSRNLTLLCVPFKHSLFPLQSLRALLIPLLVSSISIPTPPPNRFSLVIKHKRNRTASQRQKRQQRTRPLVSKTMIHLGRKQHHTSSPETPNASLGRQSRRRQVLVAVHQVVVCAVVQEDETETNGSTS